MKEILKNKKILYVILLGIVFLMSMSLSYAWFNFSISGNENAKNTIVQSGTLDLTFIDGPSIESNAIQPGWNKTKTFTVENTGTFETIYTINLDVDINTIINNELIYAIYKDEQVVASGVVPINSDILIDGIEIGVDEIHNYTIEFEFMEMSSEQNYNQGKEFNAKIQINESLFEDAEVVAMYVDNVRVQSLDSMKDYNLINYSCTNDETVSWDYNNFEISIKPLTNKTKCTLYFEEKVYLTLYEQIIQDNPTIKEDSSSLFANIADEASESGLFRTTILSRNEDIDGDGIGEEVLYFRGVVENNYVVFANYCWRIVRTNESGKSIKLRYGGEAQIGEQIICPQTGADVRISVGGNNLFAPSYQDWSKSNLKSKVEMWYSENIETQGESVTNLVADEAFCNEISNNYNIGEVRLSKNKIPQYKCTKESYKYSVSKGNINKPIAILTADELAYAGAVYGSANENYFLFSRVGEGDAYYLMTPFSSGYECVAGKTGAITYSNKNVERGLIPSISLDLNAVIQEGGTGTYNNPYVIVTN